ncbi:MAG: hypothetical protein AB7V50_07450 [Vampirovibrionia bacterium]
MSVSFSGITNNTPLNNNKTINPQQTAVQTAQKADSVSFGNAATKIASNPQAKGLIKTVINFILEKGKTILVALLNFLKSAKGQMAEQAGKVEEAVSKTAKTVHDSSRRLSKAFERH